MSSINDSLTALLSLDGALAAAIVDSGSGMMLGGAGSGIDLEVAAAGNTEILRAKARTMSSLGINEQIDDILITLAKQYHVLKPLTRNPEMFVYLVLHSGRSNLALSRLKVKEIEKTVEL